VRRRDRKKEVTVRIGHGRNLCKAMTTKKIFKVRLGKAESGISRCDTSKIKQEARARTRDEVGRKTCSKRRSELVPLERGCYTSCLPLRALNARTLGAEDSSTYIYLYRVCLRGNSRRKKIYNTRMNKHVHTYMSTNLHTYLPTYIHTYIPTYIPTKSYKPYKSYNTTLKILQTLPSPTYPTLQTLHYTTPTNNTHMCNENK